MRILMILLLHFVSFLCLFMLRNSGDAQTNPGDQKFFCSRGSNNTASTNYTNNLNYLFYRKLYDEGVNSLYHNAAAGDYPDKVYGIYYCLYDISLQICQNCIIEAMDTLIRLCNGTKEAVIWSNFCELHYSNKFFASTPEAYPTLCVFNDKDAPEPDKFSQILNQTFKDVIPDAASSDSKNAAHSVNISSFDTLYIVAQCIPDLSIQDCSYCLNIAAAQIPTRGQGKKGARIFNPSCSIRYELYPFLNVHKDGVSAPVFTAPSKTGRRWIAIGTTVSAIIILVLCSSFLWRRRRRNQRVQEEKSKCQEIQLLHHYSFEDVIQGEKRVESQEFPLLPLDLIVQATQDFSDENKLGEGGFGPVYKGMLSDGKVIAVKRLSRTSGQGLEEFKNEVTVIAKLQHKNLVRLLGCCLEDNESLLIYEYMPNKSLDDFLFDSRKSVQLDWNTRKSIVNGIARGVLYLHEDSRLKIIHRDLKVSNILLDHEMNPKISDFGMARIFSGNQSEANTNRVVGTYGYMAPEYAMEGIFSVKSDIFSFGVLLLEIISGRKSSGFYQSEYGCQSLLAYTWKLWCKGKIIELMDPILKQSSVPAELLKLIHIGLLCVQEDPKERPSMSSVVVMLASDNITLPQPTQPAFSNGRIILKTYSEVFCSINEVTLSDVSPC